MTITYGQFKLTEKGKDFLQNSSLKDRAPAIQEILDSIAENSNLPVDQDEIEFLEMLFSSNLIEQNKDRE